MVQFVSEVVGVVSSSLASSSHVSYPAVLAWVTGACGETDSGGLVCAGDCVGNPTSPTSPRMLRKAPTASSKAPTPLRTTGAIDGFVLDSLCPYASSSTM